MQIILIRHTSVDVPQGTCYGWSDVPLKETFAEEAAETLRNITPLMPFDAVFSSPLTRARRLAAFCGYSNPQVDNRLKEMHMGEWEMKRYEDIDDENLQLWYDDYMNVATTNGESFQTFYARVKSFLDELKTMPHRRVAIFAHGGVLICAGLYAGIFSSKNAFDNLTPFGGIMQIEI